LKFAVDSCNSATTTTHPFRNFTESHVAVAQQRSDPIELLFREVLSFGSDHVWPPAGLRTGDKWIEIERPIEHIGILRKKTCVGIKLPQTRSRILGRWSTEMRRTRFIIRALKTLSTDNLDACFSTHYLSLTFQFLRHGCNRYSLFPSLKLRCQSLKPAPANPRLSTMAE